jgi:hypothetical protein
MRCYFLFFSSLLLLSSCDYFRVAGAKSGEKILAKVDNEYLYLSDIQEVVTGRLNEDSIKILKSYIDSWVKRKMLLNKAQEYVSIEDAGIDKKLEAYKESLLLYEYEKELVKQKLDNAVKPIEIGDYYNKNKSNFILENDVYLINYIVINAEAEDLEKIKPLINKAKTEDDWRTIEGYCKVYATNYNLGEGVWRTSSAIISEFIKTEESLSLSVSSSFREFKQEDKIVMLKVKEMKTKGMTTPLEFVQDQIKEILMNKKKLSLIENTYDKLLQEGVSNKSVEIFVQ